MVEKEDIKVSVVVPTFQRKVTFLNRAVESLLNQSYKNIEVLIVDDNTNDSIWRKNTKEYALSLSDKRIVYIENERNLGGALSRNVGIREASGQYITFLDDDDEYLPEKIKQQLEFMIVNGYDMTFTDLKLVNKEKVVVDYREHSHIKSFKKEDLLKSHIMRKLTGTPTFMYKSEKLRKIGGFDNVPVGQEFHLMLKTIEANLNIGYLKRADVLAYRHSSGGISFGENKIKGEKAQYNLIKDKYFKYFTVREKMFIRFRYHAVFAVSYKRNKQYLRFMLYALLSVIMSPLDFLIEIIRFVSKLIKVNK